MIKIRGRNKEVCKALSNVKYEGKFNFKEDRGLLTLLGNLIGLEMSWLCNREKINGFGF